MQTQDNKKTKKRSSKDKQKDVNGFTVIANYKGKAELEDLSGKYTDLLNSFSDLFKLVHTPDTLKYLEPFVRVTNLLVIMNDYLNQIEFVLPRLESLVEEDKKRVDKEFENFEKNENESKN